MEKTEMISFIYAHIADKTFNYGLNIIRNHNNMCKEKVLSLKALNNGRFRLETFVPSNCITYGVFLDLREVEDIICIGKDIMIGDVLEYSKRFTDFYDEQQGVMNLKDRIHQYLPRYWLDMTKPIDYQSKECIDFIYNILSKPVQLHPF